MIVIQLGRPFHFNGVKIVKKGKQQGKISPVMVGVFTKTAYFDTIYFRERHAIFLGEIKHLKKHICVLNPPTNCLNFKKK